MFTDTARSADSETFKPPMSTNGLWLEKKNPLSVHPCAYLSLNFSIDQMIIRRQQYPVVSPEPAVRWFQVCESVLPHIIAR